MRHITEEYGSKCNSLELTREQYLAIEPFLLNLGIRSRLTKVSSVRNEKTGKMEELCTMQAENPYEHWIGKNEREIAEKALTPDSVECYKY